MSGFVYVLQCNNTGLYKLGKTKQLDARLSDLSSVKDKTLKPDSHQSFTVVATFKYHKFNLYSGVERQLHRMFKPWRVVGEWFNLTDAQLSALLYYCSQVQHTQTL